MPQFLFDTEHLTLYQRGHPQVVQRLAAQPANSVGISAVTVEEQLRGRLLSLSRHRAGPLRVVAYADLVKTVNLFTGFPIVAFDQASEDQFQQLRALKSGIGAQDLRIASVALVNKLIVLTRNRRDFVPVPGLVVHDWSV
jgi:tRNA(fMet)-specific endonuclease VapC